RTHDAAVPGRPKRPVVVHRPSLAVAHGGAANLDPDQGRGDATDSLDGAVRRPVIGPLARADTFMQLEGTDIEFTREADVSIPINRRRRGIAYALRGSGMIEKKPVEMSHGALFENVSKVALYGSPGFRVF